MTGAARARRAETALVPIKNSVWGDAIGRQLQEQGLTQTELARLAGINRGTVQHILRGGHCHTETLERISIALGLPLADLFQEPIDIGLRRDKIVAAVLRELSESIGDAVAEHLGRRRLSQGRRRRAETRLPFTD
jgi:transcriptional regulator with XRE-family HTH domain